MRDIKFAHKLFRVCSELDMVAKTKLLETKDFDAMQKLLLDRFNIDVKFVNEVNELCHVSLDYVLNINSWMQNDKAISKELNDNLQKELTRLIKLPKNTRMKGEELFKVFESKAIKAGIEDQIQLLKEIGAGKVDTKNFKVITKKPIKVTINFRSDILRNFIKGMDVSFSDAMASIIIHEIGHVMYDLIYMFETGEYNVKLLHVLSSGGSRDLLSKHFDIKLEDGDTPEALVNNYQKINSLFGKIRNNIKETAHKQAAFEFLADELAISLGVSHGLHIILTHDKFSIDSILPKTLITTVEMATNALALIPMKQIPLGLKAALIIMPAFFNLLSQHSDFRRDVNIATAYDPHGSKAQRLSFAIASYVKMLKENPHIPKSELKVILEEVTVLEEEFDKSEGLSTISDDATITYVLLFDVVSLATAIAFPVSQLVTNLVIFSVAKDGGKLLQTRLITNTTRNYNEQLDDTIETILANNKLYLASWKLELLQGK